MGLGATIKVGLDSSAVKRGLATIKSSFARLGGMLKGMGNLARKAFSLPGLLVGGVLAKSAMDVARLGEELEATSIQTGVAVDKIVMLQHALRNADVPIADTAKMLSTLASNLAEARTGKGPAFEALWDLGLLARDLPRDLDEAFFALMRHIKEMGPKAEGLEETIAGLFGGVRNPYSLLRLAKDLDAVMERTAKTSKGSAEFWKENASLLGDAADAAERVGDQFRQVIARVMVLIPWDKIKAALESFDVHAFVEGIGSFFSKFGASLESMMESLMENAKAVGMMVGEGIKESLKGGLRDLMPEGGGFMRLFDKLHGAGGAAIQPTVSMGRAMPGGDTSSMTKLQETTNKILGRIERREGASWA